MPEESQMSAPDATVDGAASAMGSWATPPEAEGAAPRAPVTPPWRGKRAVGPPGDWGPPVRKRAAKEKRAARSLAKAFPDLVRYDHKREGGNALRVATTIVYYYKITIFPLWASTTKI